MEFKVGMNVRVKVKDRWKYEMGGDTVCIDEILNEGYLIIGIWNYRKFAFYGDQLEMAGFFTDEDYECI